MKLQMTNKLTFYVQGPKRHGPRLSGGRGSKLQAGVSIYGMASHRYPDG